jgi:hypothetical protein
MPHLRDNTIRATIPTAATLRIRLRSSIKAIKTLTSSNRNTDTANSLDTVITNNRVMVNSQAMANRRVTVASSMANLELQAAPLKAIAA